MTTSRRPAQPRRRPQHARAGLPSVGTTAILNEQPETHSRRSGVAFDQTITPAPVSVRPGSVPPSRRGSRTFPPSHVSTVVEPATSPKQTTTFRTATGEVADTALTSPGKRRTVIAVGSIVGLAAVGLAITILVTRPSNQPRGRPNQRPRHPPQTPPRSPRPRPRSPSAFPLCAPATPCPAAEMAPAPAEEPNRTRRAAPASPRRVAKRWPTSPNPRPRPKLHRPRPVARRTPSAGRPSRARLRSRPCFATRRSSSATH
jgi:hypothetical protein